MSPARMPEDARDPRPRVGERVGRRLADGVVARRVAEPAREVRHHRLEHLGAHRRGRGVVEVEHAHRRRPSARSGCRARGRARGAECVSAPTEMTSTPVSAIARTVSSDTPPDASTVARPPTCSTPRRRSSSEKLSSMIVPIPAASTGSIWSRRSTSTSTCVVCGSRAIAPCSAAVTETPFCGEHGEVVVLGHDGVRQRVAVVVAAAVDDGVPLERPQARRRLAGVGDARAGVRDLGDVARGERRDARHPLHEVEADALGRQHRARGTRDDGEHGALLEPLAVLDDQLDVDARDRSAGTPPRTRRRR